MDHEGHGAGWCDNDEDRWTLSSGVLQGRPPGETAIGLWLKCWEASGHRKMSKGVSGKGNSRCKDPGAEFGLIRDTYFSVSEVSFREGYVIGITPGISPSSCVSVPEEVQWLLTGKLRQISAHAQLICILTLGSKLLVLSELSVVLLLQRQLHPVRTEKQDPCPARTLHVTGLV